ncbi:MAG: CBS domain-containing protein [candidate division Zixibacteria bacterium]|jgi:CBS-domain-containing membrane protein|nr:CBS domain-containing protein [candidate division Zixibacteria bacterium]
MDDKLVKDVMVPLDACAVVSEDASFAEIFRALDRAQKNLPPGRHPYQTVLVTDRRRRVVGKIGQLAMLRALEPKYTMLAGLDAVPGAGVNEQFLLSIMDHYEFFQDRLSDLCRAALNIPAKSIMHPVSENIDENMSLNEAIHKLITWEALSVPVNREGDIVGLLRLPDLFAELSRTVLVIAGHADAGAGD